MGITQVKQKKPEMMCKACGTETATDNTRLCDVCWRIFIAMRSTKKEVVKKIFDYVYR